MFLPILYVECSYNLLVQVLAAHLHSTKGCRSPQYRLREFHNSALQRYFEHIHTLLFLKVQSGQHSH